MSLNIKNEHVHDLVRTAAERTGLSQTSVVERALTELLRQLDADHEARWAEVDQLVASIHASLARSDGQFWTDEDLYDEMGLPR